MEQRIVCAAIKSLDSDKVICGIRHYDWIMIDAVNAIDEQETLKATWPSLSNWARPRVVQGFVDNKGKFLTREEAYVVAKEAGQIIRDVDKYIGILYSEHIY